MPFTVSEELVQKITSKSYASLSDAADIGERILLAIDVIGGNEKRLNENFTHFNLFGHKSFLEELASTISYDSSEEDTYLLEIASLVQRDLYKWVRKHDLLEFNWGYVKASNSKDLIISSK